MKKLGFIDYYLSEWHANNYPTWIKEVAGSDFKVVFAWAEKDISPVDGVSTDEWCSKMGITKCETIAEVCKKSDAVIILAPSNPEKHLSYAKEVLQYKKPTYIDKTFAPDFKTAKEIFDIAKKYGTKFFTTSALRYADELSLIQDADTLILTGGGRDFNEYIIHLVEMTVILLNDPVNKVKVESQKQQRICRVETVSGKMATLILAYGADYTITGMTTSGKNKMVTVKSDFFKKLISDMIRFFENKQVSFDISQTLEVMKLRDALINAEKHDGRWIELSAIF